MFEIPEELEGTVLGFAVTTVIFLFVMYLIIRNFRKRTKRCTQTVSAEVFVNGSRMFRSGGKRHRVIKPTYQYEYNGNKYLSSDLFAVSGKAYKQGQIVQIRIDPENPEICYGPKQMRAYYFAMVMLPLIPYAVAVFCTWANIYTVTHPIE